MPPMFSVCSATWITHGVYWDISHSIHSDSEQCMYMNLIACVCISVVVTGRVSSCWQLRIRLRSFRAQELRSVRPDSTRLSGDRLAHENFVRRGSLCTVVYLYRSNGNMRSS